MRLEIEKFIEKDEGYMRRTKIICTIGPASCSEEVMRELLLAGLNVARMNFSHGTHESHAEMIARFRKVRDELKLPAAVMLDTKGPEIRLGLFDEPVEVVPGQTYTFSTVETPGTAEKCFVNYAELPADVKSGDMLLVDDGDLSFRVEETTDTEIRCTVIDGGMMKSQKGVNIPGVRLNMPFLSERDKSDLLFGIEQNVDYVAASFTRRAQDIIDMRSFLNSHGGEGEIRKKIVEDDLVEAIVAMPTNLFYSVTIPVTLWFISRGKKNKGKTVFIDARKMGTMVDRIHRDLSDEDISRIADTVQAFQNDTLKDEMGFCTVKTIQEIAAQDYVLTPGRYVGIEEQEEDGEPFEEKMTRLTSELSGLFEQSHKLEAEIREKLGAIGYEI